MAISAVADPPVAMSTLLYAIILLRSLQRTSILVAYASPWPFSMRPISRPKFCIVGGARLLNWSARALAATFSFVYTMAEKSLSSQLRAISSTARDRVFPAPNTPATHRSDLPVRIASNIAMVTVSRWPSPCAANGMRQFR